MQIFPIIKLKYPFELLEIDAETIAVAVGDGAEAFRGVIKLDNDPAVFMFRKLQEGVTLPDLILACMKRYDDCDVEQAGPNVLAFLDQLSEKGLLVQSPEGGLCLPDESQR